MSLAVSIASVTALTYLFAVLDRWIASGGYAKPYFAVHVLHNAAIVAAAASDVLVSFTDFGRLTERPVSWSAVYLCYALHLYHCLLYWRTFHMDDWLHHGLMIGVALPLGSTVPAGPLMGMNLFFTTGLPGGVSYALLFAEKNGWITQAVSRRWNARVNLWIRSPGCVAQAALTLAVILSSAEATKWETAVALAVAALTLWNGQYFMEQVVSANAITAVLNIREDGKADAHSRGLVPTGASGDALREPLPSLLEPQPSASGAAGVHPPL
jgi:hypothetical protein